MLIQNSLRGDRQGRSRSMLRDGDQRHKKAFCALSSDVVASISMDSSDSIDSGREFENNFNVLCRSRSHEIGVRSHRIGRRPHEIGSRSHKIGLRSHDIGACRRRVTLV